MSVLRPLLSGIVDYAGLFPPSALDMATAVRNYAEYRHDAAAWMLGRFVVPAARLDDFAREFDAVDDPTRDPWLISALLGADAAADVARIDAFNDAHVERVRVDTLEGKGTTPDAIAAMAAGAGERFALYVEVPIDTDPAPLIGAIASAGVSAKIRTGGVTPDAFPPAGDVVRFMRRCAERRVPFKATAGLHHPIRAEHRLTYAPDAPRGVMYGYLNVFLTAALLDQLSDREAIALIEETDPRAILVTRDTIHWRGFDLRADQANVARERVAASFGSCSFREPVDDLRALALLP